nr:type I polyketide synthase [Actinokineospora pegani]
MDPQQRLVLETAWEALERAGLRPADLAGTRTGVYLGAMASDYGHGLQDLDALDGYVGTGKAGSILSGRLSYTLGLQGPAVTVDTACSSSLVAVHLAAAGLRSRECDVALVGGVTVMSSPYLFVEFSRLRAMSPHGRCKSFSADADGAGWSEGCGVVVLKRLSDAQRDGDDILAVVRGSAVNQDGRSQGLTAPNGPAQQRVVRDALSSAGLTPSDVDAIEAHGTGTSLGDPIEAGALAEVFAERTEPVWLGSAKSNLGHTQAAAGVVGLIKMILALRNGTLPRTLHADTPTPHVDWDTAKLALLTEAQPWTRGERARRAGVSSFGLSGTNAHVVIEEAPAAEPAELSTASLPLPLLVSGRDRDALRAQAARWADWLDANPVDPLDVVRTAALRTHHASRAAISPADIPAALRALADGAPHPGLRTGDKRDGTTALLFTGQGSQRPGMGAGLRAFAVFAAAHDEVAAALDPHLSRPLAQVLGTDAVHRTEFTQPALFAFEVALHRLLESWGVRADVLLGHSIGEVAAAHVAGILTLGDAARLVAARGALMQACPEGGAMVSLEATEAEVLAEIEGETGVAVAGLNGPRQTVLSGDAETVSAVADRFAGQGRRVKRLTVSHAFHSPHMDPMLERYAAVAASCAFTAPRIPVVSTATGETTGPDTAPGEGMLDPAHWVRQVREPVRFLDAVRAARADRHVEVGPGAVLSAMAAACLPATAKVAAALAGDTVDEVAAVAAGFAEAHTAGVDVDWSAVAGSGPVVALPTYAFQRTRHWVEPTRGADPGALGLTPAGHPWLGAVTAVAGEGDRHLFTGSVPRAAHTWLRDHTVLGTALVPGSGLLDLAASAARHVGAPGVGELTLLDPLTLPADGAPLVLQVAVEAPRPDGARPVTVHSRVEDGSGLAVWRRHAEGHTATSTEESAAGFADLATWPPANTEEVDVEQGYTDLADSGVAYGPAFRGVTEAHLAGTTVYAAVRLPEGLSAEGFGVHPALLDAALHAAAVADPGGPVRLPFSLRGVVPGATGATALRVRLDRHGDDVRLWAVDEAGAPVLHVAALATRAVDPAALRATTHLYALRETEPASPVHEDRPLWEFTGLDALTERLDAGQTPGRLLVPAGPGALGELRALLAETRLAGAELVWRTTDATTDPDQAAVWGLVRAARAEHPDRGLRLVDAPAGADTAAALSLVGEPEVLVRPDGVRVPRLVPAETAGRPPALSTGVVLITGGTGDLGAALAEHLVRAHGARSLRLVSRRGPAAPGAEELAARLRAEGAAVELRACDVTDAAAVAEAVTADVTAVFHLAGVLDDALLGAQDPERVAAVAAPKVEGARNLHAAVAGLDLAAFVLFSSASGVLGGAGQAGYAAANAALDALAARRRADGLPALSLAWGMWDQTGGMTAGLGEAERAALRAGGIAPLTREQGLDALDTALGGGADAVLVPVRLDLAALRAADDVPPPLRGLVRTRAPRPAAATGLRDRLAALPAERRTAELTALVAAEAGAALGGRALAADRVFADAGLDSVMAMELRGRLAEATGLALPATLAFDHPSPAAVAEHLLGRLDLGHRARPTHVAARGAADEPIAVVGLAVRLPGGVADPEGFWELLAEGRDAIGPFPARWAHLDLFDPDPDVPGRCTVREGGFLDDVAGFDHDFFGVSPREAVAMDPQQRLVLEASWEALERAGVRPGDLTGSRTGVYLGTMGSDYGNGRTLAELDGYYGTGNATAVLSGRVSYTLGLQGPAVSVDTACSSSLVALHLAAQALRAGECELALAGGVTVMSTPTPFVEFSRLKGLSSDGRCRSFGAGADGTGWAEGAGVLVLKPLSAAQRDGDRVLAVLRGSAINSDGRSQGLTAPNGPSQQRVIRDALAASGIEPSDVDAIEAHGTGTPLGDPIEAGALAEVFGPGRAAPLALGSVKSNLGHTQAAAGVVGVIKVVLALDNETLPATLGAAEPSPLVDWAGGRLALLTEATPWPRGQRVRRAGVSSFGLSGTNAHVVVEEAPEQAATPTAEAGRALPVVVSGQTEDAVREQAARWADWIERTGAPLADVAHTAARLRTAFPHRAAVVAADSAEAVAALRSVTDAPAAPGGALAVLFTGQGSQRAGMGARLRAESPVFAAAFDAAAAALDPHLSRPLAEVLDNADLLVRTEFAQPALFAVEVAGFRLAEALGARPTAVAGHSVGELAAAHVAGVLSLDDAARLVAARGRLMQACRPDGAMASIQAAEADVLAALPGGAAIAGLNGPRQTVVSGDGDAVAAVVAEFAGRGVRTKALEVSHAFHSPHMDEMLDAYAEVARSCAFAEPALTVVSAVTGAVAGPELLDPAHWVRQVREPVRFLDAVTALEALGVRRYLESGPAPVLAPMAAGCVADDSPSAFAPLLGADGRDGLAHAAAAVFGLGVDVDWDAALPESAAAALPTYAFQRVHHWSVAGAGKGDLGACGLAEGAHPWLPAVTALADGGHLLTGRVSTIDTPWLAEHRVFGSALVPGTGLLDLAMAAAAATGSTGVAELDLAAPLSLPENGARALQVRVSAPGPDGRRDVEVHSRPDGGGAWTRHATGAIADAATEPLPAPDTADLRVWPVPGAEPVDLTGLHDRLAERGLDYGPAFRGLVEAAKRGRTAFGRVVLPAEAGAPDGFGVHPALLDAALHALAAVTPDGGEHGTVLLPVGWTGVALTATGATELRVRLELADGGDDPVATVAVADGTGAPVAAAAGLALRRVRPEQLRPAPEVAEDLYRVDFRPVADLAGPSGPLDGVAVVGAGPLAAALDLSADPATARVLLVDATAADDPVGATLAAVRQLGELTATAAEEIVWVTRDAVAARPGDPVSHLAAAPLWGLVRAARAEHPDRALRLVDLQPGTGAEGIAAALAVTGEPELAVRGDQVLAPRLVPVDTGTALAAPAGPWRVDTAERGSFDALRAVPITRAELPAGHVRVRITAAGVNFRDVLNALDVVHAPALGLECAGVVAETGPGVSGLAVGDRVLGLGVGTFGTEVDVDTRLLLPTPAHLSDTEAATVPLAYLTAHHALVTLAGLRQGQRLLVHAAAGGVGMAAVHLARHLGLEVYATASPGKWATLRAMGVPDERIASSRDTGFAEAFLAETGGAGVDAVLNALAGEFVDASLRLLPGGGHFLEMGKTDVRDAEEVAAVHPGVVYRAFDLMAGGNDRVAAEFAALSALPPRVVTPLAHTAYDVREAPEAFRFMAQGRHIGKLVLTTPRPLDPAGTALVTGGVGGLGRLVCEHLAREHGVRELVVASRRGPDGPGAAELVADLAAHGARVRVVACDIADRDQVADLVAAVHPAHPLTAVVHLAAVLDDGVLANLTPERVRAVLGPKVVGAGHLHELTRGADLAAFVLFSSLAGTLGAAGQSAYAAANAHLDALAAHRRALGLAATSLAWGPWAPTASGMTAGLGAADLARVRRQGAEPIEVERGLRLLDQALARPHAHQVPVRLRPVGDDVPALLRALVAPRLRQAAASEQAGGVAARLAGLTAEQRVAELTKVVRAEAGGVLGHDGGGQVGADRALRDLGWDSLMAVELRNRLAKATALALPTSLTYDYPTAHDIAGYLAERLDAQAPAAGSTDTAPEDPVAAAHWAITRLGPDALRDSGLLARLLDLTGPGAPEPAERPVEELSDEEIDLELDAVLGFD